MSNLVAYIVTSLACIAGLIFAYITGHAKGKASAQVAQSKQDAAVSIAQTQKATDERISAKEDAENAKDQANNLDAGALADRLQQYVREERNDGR